MIYEKNLNALKERYIDLYNMIIETDELYGSDVVFIEDAKNEEKIIKYSKEGKDVYLNSKYNPTSEADRFMNDCYDMADKSLLTMFGLANCSYIKAFVANKKKDINCVIYEPDSRVFVQVLRNIDISEILSDTTIAIIVGDWFGQLFPMFLNDLVQAYNKDNNKSVILPKYDELFSDELQIYKDAIRERGDRLTAEMFTVKSMGLKTCKNSIYNMQYLKGCISGADYENVFPENLPAIIVSAGPSLVKNVELLKEIKDKAFILVVDTAIPKVMKRGIIPDAIISVDYGKSLKHFKVDGLQDIPFIADSDMNTAVLDFVKSKNVIFNSSDSMVFRKLFEKVGSTIYNVEEGGSVSTAAIAHMISWGFKKIILIGQDLALTGNKVHADDGEFPDDLMRWATTMVKDVDGNDILTRKDYCSYIRWIEEIAYKFNDIEIIDATEGGALIQHTKVMTLREAIDKYCTEECDIKGVLEKAPRLFEGEDVNYIVSAIDSLISSFRNLRKMLINGVADCIMGAKLLSRGEFNVKELKRINATIAKLDQRIMESDERIYITKYVSDADFDMAEDMFAEEEDHIKESIRMYNKSEKYYESIVKAIPEIIEHFEACKEKILNE